MVEQINRRLICSSRGSTLSCGRDAYAGISRDIGVMPAGLSQATHAQAQVGDGA